MCIVPQEELSGIEPRRRMRYENPSEARLLREAYARTTRRPHTETFAEKVVRIYHEFFYRSLLDIIIYLTIQIPL